MNFNGIITGLLLAGALSGVTHAETYSYTIGDKALGGTVFYVTADGSHGLVVSNIDQGNTMFSLAAEYCTDPQRFDTEGQAYTDWKVPTETQLTKIYEQRFVIGGGIQEKSYWGWPRPNNMAPYIDFKTGGHAVVNTRGGNKWLRCIRSF
ncbi:hypothetical protein [Legionella sp. CNM-4043-24]|uniref:hypothetical protein n=1 Tax=Legionella sp. CNM-4043-24 TaxID=3421646 RepID=UPI00403AF7C5